MINDLEKKKKKERKQEKGSQEPFVEQCHPHEQSTAWQSEKLIQLPILLNDNSPQNGKKE